MPAHRKPTALLEAQGTIAHDPKKYADRQNEPAPTPLDLQAPEHFDGEMTLIWHEVTSLLHHGTYGNQDRIAIEQFCKLVHTLRTAEVVSGAVHSALLGMYARFGMTPADRSRVQVQKEKAKDAADPWAGFDA